MASGDSLIAFTPLSNQPPATNNATLDTRNSHSVLDFDPTTNEDGIFGGDMPQHYAGGDIQVVLKWTMSTAVADTCQWQVSVEAGKDGVLDLDTDSFSAPVAGVAETVPGVSGQVKYTTITLTNAQADSVAAGDGFRLKVTRNAAGDTAAGDAELWRCELREA